MGLLSRSLPASDGFVRGRVPASPGVRRPSTGDEKAEPRALRRLARGSTERGFGCHVRV